MDPRDFFTAHHWWGKFIGASLGFLILGPVGALFGILIGNLFDRGLTEHFSKPHWFYHAENRPAVKQAFCEATFAVMGHVLKTDGRITEAQIQMVVQLMNDMKLRNSQRRQAEHCFREGKKSNFNLWKTLHSLQELATVNPNLLKLFIDLQFQAAQVGGLSSNKLSELNAILSYLGFAPLHQQYRFREDFRRSHHRTNNNQSSYMGNRDSSNGASYAFDLLGIPQTATKQEVTKAYRRLMSQHHPDKLIAKGLPESSIKSANEKTQQIRKAYEKICAQKGW